MSSIAGKPPLDLPTLNPQSAPSIRTRSERHTGIEIGRIVACLAVIFIHQQSSHYGHNNNVRESLDLASRWAVPFFFLISGYFLPVGTGWFKVSRKYFFRLLPVFLFWATVYAAIDGNPFWFLSELRIIRQTMTNGGTGFHLWFLPSLGVCLVVAAAVRHYFSMNFLLLLSVSLYCFGLIHGSYEVAVDDLPFHEVDRSFNPRNGPFMGLIFVSLGIALRAKLFEPSIGKGLALIGLGALLSIAEALFLLSFYQVPIFTHNFLIGTVPLGSGVAMLCLSINIKTPLLASAIRRIGAVSLGIYALHVLVLWEVTDLVEPNSLVSGFSTAVLTLAIATVGALIGAQVPVMRRMFL